MLTKAEMVERIVKLYGRGSKMALWFAEVASTKDYEHTKKLFYKMVEQQGRH